MHPTPTRVLSVPARATVPLPLALGLALSSLAGGAAAQIAESDRKVHPSIAAPVPVPGATLVPAPLFAVDDGSWNHGEGFRPAVADADRGGWHEADDGTGVEIGDVHFASSTPWELFNWSSPFYANGSNQQMLRAEGWLDPSSTLATEHPKYGTVGPYVDQGAFELFMPMVGPQPNQKIVICMMTWETFLFPSDWQGSSRSWRQVYPGFFSPDGLIRNEAQPGTGSAPQAVDFLANDDDANGVVRRPTALELLPSWNPSSEYWLVMAYPVPSVMHRQATLNEQRYMQLLHAIKLLLQQSDASNPLVHHGQAVLDATQVDARTVAVFVGNSNGGLAAEFATLRHPELVHGCFSQVFPPCWQRGYSEHDMVEVVGYLTGEGPAAGGLSADDFLHWNKYSWEQNLEMRDLSYLRLFFEGRTNRPAFFAVGDEDVTSTGIDWVRVLSADGAWRDHGIAAPGSGQQPQLFAPHAIAWAVAENGCHQRSVVPMVDPYAPAAPIYDSVQVAHSLFSAACAQRDYELSHPGLPAPTPLQANPRTSELRGLDEPHEWALGRLGEPLPSPDIGGVLTRDDAFFAEANANSCGVIPGRREAMLVRDGRVFVGSADGLVSSFEVDDAHPKQPLVRRAQSVPLGQGATAIAALVDGGDWSLVVGTRRHLHKLHPQTLAKTAASRLLPWEVSLPHHLAVADVLPGHPGDEVIYASRVGGLVFYDTDLQFVHEWPEPGIRDFVVQGATVTILSTRGLLANVTFSGPEHTASLRAASAPLPPEGSYDDPMLASQGLPGDLEPMRLDLQPLGLGTPIAMVSSWSGDIDAPVGSQAIRLHASDALQRVMLTPYLAQSDAWLDLATCSQQNGYYGGSPDTGDHLLALRSDGTLRLIDQVGNTLGEKKLTTTEQGYWPFAAGAHAICVGELVANSGSYEQEIVVATNTGLMWLHVDDLLGGGSELPAAAPAGEHDPVGYWIESERSEGVDPGTQPRTNSTLAGAWAIARRPDPGLPGGFDDRLHIVDQRGVYWRVDHTGRTSLWEREELARGTRSIGFVPYSNASLAAGAGFTQWFGPRGYLEVGALPSGAGSAIVTTPWAPNDPENVVYQANTPVDFDWERYPRGRTELDGFLTFDRAACVVQVAGSHTEAWTWSAAGGDWANLVEGFRVDPFGVVDGTWQSIASPSPTGLQPATTASNLAHHFLRSFTSGTPAMQQASIHAVRTANQSPVTVLLLGCPGGRVRAIQPGVWRNGNEPNPHQAHGIGTILDSTEDMGFGGMAMAVRDESTPGNTQVRIWFGTAVHPTARPAGYATGGTLGDSEVATGAIHMFTFDGNTMSFSEVQDEVVLYPGGQHPRGGYAVCGLQVADLLPTLAGDELIATTLAGDLIIYHIESTSHQLLEVVRTHVPGSIGCYDSILVEDLDDDGKPELYLGGSVGLWRFVLPGE